MNIFKSLLRGSSTNSLSAAEAKTRLDQHEPLFVLDVRELDEYRNGHIAHARLIPLGALAGRLNEIPKDQPILCVCASGSRSSAAARMLAEAGFNVLNLAGGMLGWQRAGYPVEKGK